jgi:hypothetical protein
MFASSFTKLSNGVLIRPPQPGRRVCGINTHNPAYFFELYLSLRLKELMSRRNDGSNTQLTPVKQKATEQEKKTLIMPKSNGAFS